jgi:hypothetical protein
MLGLFYNKTYGVTLLQEEHMRDTSIADILEIHKGVRILYIIVEYRTEEEIRQQAEDEQAEYLAQGTPSPLCFGSPRLLKKRTHENILSLSPPPSSQPRRASVDSESSPISSSRAVAKRLRQRSNSIPAGLPAELEGDVVISDSPTKA